MDVWIRVSSSNSESDTVHRLTATSTADVPPGLYLACIMPIIINPFNDLAVPSRRPNLAKQQAPMERMKSYEMYPLEGTGILAWFLRRVPASCTSLVVRALSNVPRGEQQLQGHHHIKRAVLNSSFNPLVRNF
jgi:hypothetical protein